MTETQPAAEWFAQFDPSPEGWSHDQWCWKHWAPCPLLGANGVGAALAVTQAFMALPGFTPDAPNTKMCCALGDDVMHEIWGRWPPPGYTTDKAGV